MSLYNVICTLQTRREKHGSCEWSKMADTHKMSPEEVKRAGVEASKRPPGHNPGGVLHQRRNLPFTPTGMLIGGFLICTAIGYFTLYAKKNPEVSARDVARVSANIADPDDTKPRPGRKEGNKY